ncbi:hypothetical protein Poli38472_006881 [Pythium oligandrum]|uniref:COP9 signalosome complex subunit 3 n=1 Tax=Pythium oligandrum TaxID=41045 RepID=A0A8K1C5D2_PYTOL|nr:hypothetical protein Poli38472_006881 [Pythium oligandrum]|eukprot:TMW56871.1 hypothetical protein Poli38472_006881 [Pythium oligandrum]
MTSWGPLQPLYAQLLKEEQQQDGEKDRRQADLALARVLNSDETSQAITNASLEQLDLALAHDALAVERKPLCHLFLLSTKSAKVEQFVARRATTDDSVQWLGIASRLVAQVSQFLYQVPVYVASKEIRRVSSLCVHYVNLVVGLQQGIRAVFPLKSFLRRFHQHGNTDVTPIHGQFMYLCLRAKCYSAAMEILDQPLFEVHSQTHLVSAVDVLSYAYYGGLLYLGEKRYQDTIDLFLMAVTVPAVALSAFVVESYKKLLLASLILRGEVEPLPKYTPFVVTRHLEMHCGPYLELSRAFTGDKSVEAVAKVHETYAAVFAKDGNNGLVKQVIEALKQQKLLKLPRTYVTIPLAEMTKAADMEISGDIGAEKMLLQLVARGDMAAVIDKQKGMIKFVLDDDDHHVNNQENELEQMLAMEKLQAEMEKILHISSQLRAVDTEVVTSAKFQSRLQKDKDRRLRGGPSGGDERVGGGPPGLEGMD